MVNSFTINQTPNSQNVFLYPNGAFRSKCTPVGAVNNYQCVDDSYDLPDEDTTYVWMMNSSTVTDMYALQNHTTETGIINYVRIFSRAKSNLFLPAATADYRMLYNSGTTVRSNKCNLTTDYDIFNVTSTTTPGGNAWTWAEIDALKIGFEARSPSITGPNSMTLRPDSVGTYSQFTSSPTRANYLNVNEVIFDDSTYNYTASSPWVYDTYNIQAPFETIGTITSVVIFNVAKKRFTYAWSALTPIIITNGTLSQYGGGADWFNLTSAFALYSWELLINPVTTIAWVWADIDSLQIGPKCRTDAGVDGTIQVTQTYAVINYTATRTPEIRTTQSYAVVNYTPSTTTCFLNMPTDSSFESQYELQKHNWWNDTRTTRVLRRSSKTVSLSGFEFTTPTSVPTVRLKCVENMKDNGSPITLSGLVDPNLNSTWIISDFNYNVTENNPNIWQWNMTLEKDR